MSEVKGNLSSTNTSGPVQPTVQAVPSTSTQPTQSQNVAPQTENVKPSSTNLQFNSANGPKSSQKVDLFAEQNAKRAEKEKKQKKNRKIIVIASIVIGICVMLTALTIVIVTFLTPEPSTDNYAPEIAGSSEKDILDYQNLLQQIYNQKKEESINEEEPQEDQDTIDYINQVVQDTLKTPNGKENANAVISAQAYFYYNSGYYQEVVKLVPQINIEVLNNRLKSNLYEAAANSYSALGDSDNARYYYSLLLTVPIEENYGD